LIKFDASTCRDLAAASSREWLETNGLGGFASGTISGINTRRYHALLIAATRPPVGRLVLLSKFEETLVIGDRRVDLGANEYAGAVHPRGFELISGFKLDPFPTWTYEVERVKLQKQVFMIHGKNATVVRYKLASKTNGVKLELRPLIAFRDYHSTTHENAALDPNYDEAAGCVVLSPYAGMPQLYLSHNAQSVERQGYWYRSFEYSVERERGLDHQEDLFNPLALHFDLSAGEASVIAATEQFAASEPDTYRRQELDRRIAVAASAPVADKFAIALTSAADQFLVRRGADWTIVAGYPWFTDWGRDTMIALPGLTLYNGRTDVARSILHNFAKFVDQGMLPNRFPDAGEAAEYNTVDATLWYFEAVRAYLAATNDEAFVGDELYAVLTSIIDWHIKGSRYNIRLLENGLLNAGEAGVQLTWMDAKVGDWVVTPRGGKPVEIQALWYNALKIMEDLAQRFGRSEDVKRYRNIASLLHWTFNRVFWNENATCLYDVVNGVPDASIRPNQIFAVSLTHSMLTAERAKAVVDVVERDLLTPLGLRSLSPNDQRYRPRYEGDVRSRDSAYHQGTVWPWLLGPFVTAYVKVNGGTKNARDRALRMLARLQQHLSESGLGQMSEVADAEAPHRPGGCFAQAWSVAELLRCLCEDIYQVKRPRATKPRRTTVALRTAPVVKAKAV
jgi:predicted glycogen debranching enzyme